MLNECVLEWMKEEYLKISICVIRRIPLNSASNRTAKGSVIEYLDN